MAKVDIAKTKESYYQDIVTSTLSHITVVFEDIGVALKVHWKAKYINTVHQTTPSLLLKDGLKYEKGLVKCDQYNGMQKECFKSVEALCVFGHRKFFKSLLCILVEMYGFI